MTSKSYENVEVSSNIETSKLNNSMAPPESVLETIRLHRTHRFGKRTSEKVMQNGTSFGTEDGIVDVERPNVPGAFPEGEKEPVLFANETKNNTQQGTDKDTMTQDTESPKDLSSEPIEGFTITQSEGASDNNEKYELAEVVESTQQRDRKLTKIVGAITIILIATIVLLLVFIGNERDKEELTDAPTLAPISAEEILTKIVDIERLLDSEAPEGSAYKWLVEEDESGFLDDPETPEWRVIQRYILALLFFSTKGAEWKDRLGFLSPQHECEWKTETLYIDDSFVDVWNENMEELQERYGYIPSSSVDAFQLLKERYQVERKVSFPKGVYKCNGDGEITSISLPGNKLQGKIPNEITYLTKLQDLDLLGNLQLGGPLPAEWSLMTDLRTITLAFNRFSGSIPTEWSTLRDLQSLLVDYNRVSGTLPYELEELSKLRVLGLSNNDLRGTLPTVYGKAWPSLESIYFDWNRFEGSLPNEYGAWKNLQRADFSYSMSNPKIDQLPVEFSQWSKLRSIRLDWISLKGSLPPEYSKWGELEYASFSNNMLTGQLPKEFSRWTNLKSLSAEGNALTGILPPEYNSWQEIERLSFAGNVLSGSLPIEYSKFTKLESFDASSNSLTGTLPTEYKSWQNVKEVSFSKNSLNSTLPLSYASWGQLQHLSMASCSLQGTLPPEFGSAWTQLEYLNLAENALSGTLPLSYGSWEQLQSFEVEINALTGSLPAEYSRWTFIESVLIYGNLLSGTMPMEWSKWTNLAVLDLEWNELTGTLPSEYSSWTSLEYALFSYNGFVGTLPDTYSSWSRLQVLDVSACSLSGSLPASYGAWPDIITLWFTENSFDGSLPVEYSEWSELSIFDVSSNALTGTLPPEYGDGWESIFKPIFNDNLLTGSVPESYAAWNIESWVGFQGNNLTGLLPNGENPYWQDEDLGPRSTSMFSNICEWATGPVEVNKTIVGTTAGFYSGSWIPLCGDPEEMVVSPGKWFLVRGQGMDTIASLCHDETSFDTMISVYRGNCGASEESSGELVCVATNDDFCGARSRVIWFAEVDVDYYVLVHGYGESAGAFGLDFETSLPVDEDEMTSTFSNVCEEHVELLVPGQTLYGTTIGTSPGDNVPQCDEDLVHLDHLVASPGMWYTISGNGKELQVSLCNEATDFDTVLSIYRASCDATDLDTDTAALRCVASNDDSCDMYSQVTWFAETGVDYYVLVHGFFELAGAFGITLTELDGPE